MRIADNGVCYWFTINGEVEGYGGGESRAEEFLYLPSCPKAPGEFFVPVMGIVFLQLLACEIFFATITDDQFAGDFGGMNGHCHAISTEGGDHASGISYHEHMIFYG